MSTSAVGFAGFFYVPFKDQGLKARKPLWTALQEPTLVGSWLPPCSLPHLAESERAVAWRGLSDTCKWKWDPTWKPTRRESGGGEEGKAETDSPILRLVQWSSLAPLYSGFGNTPSKIQVPSARGGEVGLPKGVSGRWLTWLPHAIASRLWETPSLHGDLTVCRQPIPAWVLPGAVVVCGHVHLWTTPWPGLLFIVSQGG